MRISEHGNVIVMLSAAAALVAQSDVFPVKSPNPSSEAAVRQIVESSSRRHSVTGRRASATAIWSATRNGAWTRTGP